MLIELKALAVGIVPPTANLRDVDDDALGWVSGQLVQRGAAPFGLSTNSGFGGVNVALVLKAPAADLSDRSDLSDAPCDLQGAANE